MVRSKVIKSAVLGMAASLVAAGVVASADVPSSSANEVVLSNGFEDGTTQGWFGRGAAEVAASTEQANSGEASLLTTGRADTWQGPGHDMLDVLAPDTTYEIEAYVRLADAASADLHMSVQRTPAGGDTAFERVASDVTATDSGWVRIAGNYEFTSTDNDELQLYVESADASVSFYLDDVAITSAGGSEVLIDEDFEDGLGEWSARGDDTNPQVAVTTEGDPLGTQSVLVTDRAEAWHGIGHDVTTLFEPGATYDVSAWVKLGPDADPATADVRMSVQRDAEGESSFDTVATAEGVTTDEWVEIGANYTPGSFESALLYFETAGELSDIMVDDVVVTGSAAAIDPTIPDLKDTTAPVPFGVAIDGRETVGAPSDLVLKHFNQITPENHMKPVEIQPSEGEFTFGQADELMQFAADNGLNVYGHVLVWHSQVGEWMFQDPETGEPLTDSAADQELLRQRMRDHIFTFADHFRTEFGEYGEDNPLVAIDVVNEVIAESEDDGLRRSEWYRILGPDFIPLAFEYAREAFGPDVQLYINDYNTEFPSKRQVYFDRISEWLDQGVPIDGVGHQLHLSLQQPIPQVADSLELFRDLPVTQAVTELDVTMDAGGAASAPPALLAEQGYYYRDLFEVLEQHLDVLGAVTVWGPTDPRSWRSEGFPLLFDGNLQAKPAYWGIVDPSRLPVLTRQANVHAGDVPLDGSATSAFEWELLPDVEVGSSDSGFQLRWTPDHLVAYVDVADSTDDGAGDTVDLFWGDQSLTVPRSGGVESAEVSSSADGYRIVAHLPADALEEGGSVDFDVRITDGDTGAPTSWNDPDDAQEDGERLGLGNLIESVGFTDVAATRRAPVIDGEVDAAWDGAPVVSTDVQVEGSDGASADVRLLWSGSELYALAEVTDPQLDDGSSNPWEQDSVEFFVDPVNAKSGPYNPEDGQYRVNYLNEVSFGATDVGDRLTSGTSVTDDGYIVEAAIDLGYEPAEGQLIGLDLQVNDGTDGARTAVRTWTDPTGQSFQTTERWGVARLGGIACDNTVAGLHFGPLVVDSGLTCLGDDARVFGPVRVSENAGLISDGAAVVGPLRAHGADTVVLEGGVHLGPVLISGTTGEVAVTGNHIIGPVWLRDNTTEPLAITVADNTILGVLACSGNEPPPDAGDEEGNKVIGVTRGQCRNL